MLNINFSLSAQKKAEEVQEITFITDFSLQIESIHVAYLVSEYITDFSLQIESILVFKFEKTVNFLRAYTYETLIEISEEELLEKEKFLPDYHTLNFLSSETAVDKVSIASIFTAVSNLLRLCRDYEVDEIHSFSLRIVRIKREDKTYFLITDY